MKVFAIRDEEDAAGKNLAYLIYYERPKKFYIEIPDDADVWEVPLILSSFVKRGEYTVNAYWSKIWVQQRIVPTDRQNIGQILKVNGLSEYDEYELLMLGNGKCAQDSYYLIPLSEETLSDEFRQRYQRKIEDVIPLNDKKLLLFFRDGSVKKCNMQIMLKGIQKFSAILKSDTFFKKVSVQTGGYGVSWGEDLIIDDDKLYRTGKNVPLSLEDFKEFVSSCVVNTAEATEILGCSRQNIEDLVKRRKLHPVKIENKSKLFLKSEIQQRIWR